MNDALGLAAARMTRFLASDPRKGKTRAYLKTLPKREKITVSPDDYIPTRKEARASAEAQTVRDARRYADWERRGKPPSPSLPARKDRVRPSLARQRSPLLYMIAGFQNFLCPLCGERLFFGGRDQRDQTRPSVDHVIPRARGGKDHNNRLAAHIECNQRKANRPPTGCELIRVAAVNARLAAAVGVPNRARDRHPEGAETRNGAQSSAAR